MDGLNLMYELTGETTDSFYQGLVTSAQVFKIFSENEKSDGCLLKTDSGFEGRMALQDIQNNDSDGFKMTQLKLSERIVKGM